MRVGIACQGGGSHAAFTAGALQKLLRSDLEVVALSGTSGGAVCALLAWYGLLEDDLALARRLLRSFWHDISARSAWEQGLTNWGLVTYRTIGQFFSPELNPYLYPPYGQDQLRSALERHVPFARIPGLLRDSGPHLFVGAVDVRSGEFRTFRNREVTVAAILASSAVPTLFRAVEIDGRSYWDGLFSQNPPIRDLVYQRPEEIWVIQINQRARAAEPESLAGIRDRRNELAANLSLEQELRPVEAINGLLAKGRLSGTDFRRIAIRRIEMALELDSASRLDRTAPFIGHLMAHGEAQADDFLRGLGLSPG